MWLARVAASIEPVASSAVAKNSIWSANQRDRLCASSVSTLFLLLLLLALVIGCACEFAVHSWVLEISFFFFCCCCFLHFSLLTSLSLFCLFSLGRFLFFISLGAAVAVYFRFDYIFLRNCAFTARRNLNLVNVSFVCGFLYFWFFFLIFTIICCGACHLLMDLSLGKDKHIFLNLTSIDLLSLFQNIFWYFFCCCLLKRVWLVYALKYVSKILLHLCRILIILILLIFLIFILIIHMV